MNYHIRRSYRYLQLAGLSSSRFLAGTSFRTPSPFTMAVRSIAFLPQSKPPPYHLVGNAAARTATCHQSPTHRPDLSCRNELTSPCRLAYNSPLTTTLRSPWTVDANQLGRQNENVAPCTTPREATIRWVGSYTVDIERT